MKFRHGGDLWGIAKSAGMKREDIIDFSANVNPLGAPKWLRSVISSNLSRITDYPDPFCAPLIEKIAAKHNISSDEILIGNGSTELLYLLPRAVKADRALVAVPAYVDYEQAAESAKLPVETIVMSSASDFALNIATLSSRLRGGELVFIGSPNNPTGSICEASAIRSLADSCPGSTFIIDEAFADFVDRFDSLINNRPKNVVVLRSLTKIFAIPGLRLGYVIADKEIISTMKNLQPPWSVNTLAQAVGERAIGDADYIKETRVYVDDKRNELYKALVSVADLHVYQGAANYLLVRIKTDKTDAVRLAGNLLKKGIAIRACDNYDGLDNSYLRVAVRTGEENEMLLKAIKAELGIAIPPGKKSKTKAIMFQGTSSNAGKSVLTAAMCRILLQDGYSVAPFKAQNMSLNSYVTKGGGEMGRAQVVQAKACRLEPDVRMNPLLLKPSSDTGSQVILNGKPVTNMSVKEYYRYKDQAVEKVRDAYDSLAAEHDIIVLEGAGSPAEINLKQYDLVNMNMARYAEAPVILVGNIDLGGVFAAFVGTMELLEEWERKLVAGFIINRFRGDASLLGDALDYTYSHTNKRVLGVLPFIRDLGLPEEDSVEFKSGNLDHAHKSGDAIEIAVIDLPHISNFTDFDSLRLEPDVHIRTIRHQSELDSPDAIILPGSKNVINDLRYLKDNGLAEKIFTLYKEGNTEIIGICGGFQMLGDTIRDPQHIESKVDEITGMGILPISTTLAPEKTLARFSAQHVDSELDVHGYEIHHGETDIKRAAPLLRRSDGKFTGACQNNARVWGTYMHGIFDSNRFRRWFIDRLLVKNGLPPVGKVMVKYEIDSALDRLANVVRESLPIDEIYEMLGIK